MQLFNSQFSSTSSTSGSSGDMHSTHPPACSVNSVHDVNSSLGFIDTVFKDLATRTNSRKMYSPHLYKILPASCPNSPQSGQSSEASFNLSMSRTSHLEAWVLRRWQCCREVKLASQYQSKAAGKCKNTVLLMISSAGNNILCSITCQECKYVNSNHGLLKNCQEDIQWCFLMVVS